MNILYITLSKPRLSEHGIYPDLVRALKRASHKVTIVYAASPGDQKRTELTKEDGVTLLKVVVGENFNVGLIRKGINTIKMEPLLKRGIRKYLKNEHYDLCIYATPPVTFAGVVEYCKKLFGVRTFLMLKDIFPRNAVDIGLFKEGSLIHRFFRNKERKLYAISDRIGCMSEGNLQYIMEHEPWIEKDKLLVFPNTIELEPHSAPVSCIKASSAGVTSFVFGGNLGKPQAIDFLISAIGDERLAARSDIAFYIVGQGSEKDKVQRAAQRLDNLTFIDMLPPDEYDRLMERMDVGIISLDHRFTIPNYPSRILSYMKAGKPVLACTDEVTDIRELVEDKGRFGLWVSSEDRDGFVDAVIRLSGDEKMRREMGQRGFEYLRDNFEVGLSVRLLEENMRI